MSKLEEWQKAREEKLRAFCPNHTPTQHRDKLPPWCNACGFGENFEPIKSVDHIFKNTRIRSQLHDRHCK